MKNERQSRRVIFKRCCPKLQSDGLKRKKIKQLPLKPGDDIWYTDSDEIQLEHGTIYLVSYNASGKLDSFSVDFDNGDFDEFIGEALGSHFFKDKEDALEAMFRNNLSCS